MKKNDENAEFIGFTLENIFLPEEHSTIMEELDSTYDILVDEINNHITILRDKVSACNPLELLQYTADLSIFHNIGIYSETQASGEAIFLNRVTEYVQSILVSTPNHFEHESSENQLDLFQSIVDDVVNINQLITSFYLSWGVRLSKERDKDLVQNVVEAQFLYTVRGNRYQIYENEYLESLLGEHNQIFEDLFDMDADEIIRGLDKLRYALTQGKLDPINEFMELSRDIVNNHDTPKDINSDMAAKIFAGFEAIEKQFSETSDFTAFNVTAITGWNKEFVKELSYSLNEERTFFNKGQFSGWPIIDLPIQKRPFIEIEEEYYCFDYYSLADNIYRSIQKMITRLASNYQWADFQKDASENKIEDIFREILPSSKIYSENYYFQDNNKRQRYENDLLVIYEDILLIVEIKAGSFVYTPPITDFEAHINSYQNLIQTADKQCTRTLDYFLNSERPTIYEESGEQKTIIDMSKIRDVFTMSVTIDNINSFAAKAEKLQFLDLNSHTISISLDELMVYRDYFESPLYFMHFLKERKKATQVDRLTLNDELDHLGLYIEHNMYSDQVKSLPGDYLTFTGYREELDLYFSSLIHTNLDYEKPIQSIPPLFQEMILYLENNPIKNKVEIANFLLDFPLDLREYLVNNIDYAFERQRELKFMMAMNSLGSTSYSYSCFVNQPGIEKMTFKEKEDYTLSSLLWNEEEDRILLDIFLDKSQNFKKFEFYKYHRDGIEGEEIERLKKIGENNANKRIAQHKKKNPGKIGRNELCPCGTGKKYKRCCMRRTH